MRIEDVVVGKEYRIRQWDDMEKEFGILGTGSIKCNPIRFVKEMKHLCGKKCVVRQKEKERVYIDIEDSAESNVWAYTADMIEPIEENNMPIEIKPGYIVVFLDKAMREQTYTVAVQNEKGEVYCASPFGWHHIKEDYPNGFENEYYKIVKIYGLPKRGGDLFSVEGRKLLYDASVKKMTKSQIEKELGYKIEIVEE